DQNSPTRISSQAHYPCVLCAACSSSRICTWRHKEDKPDSSGRQRLAAARETRGSSAEHKNSPVTSGARFSLSGTGYPNGHNVTVSGIWVVTFVLKPIAPMYKSLG